MKKYLYFIPLLSILLFAACSSEDDLNIGTPEEPNAPMVPFEATIGEGSQPNLVAMARADKNQNDGKKKALAVDGNTIKPVWTVGEKLGLIVNNTLYEVTVSSVNANNRATISGTVPAAADGKTAKFIFPYSAIDPSTKKVKTGLLNNQDGTLETIAKDLDVREGSGFLKVSNGKAGLKEDVDLTSSFCIMRIATTCYGEDYNITNMEITSTTSNNTINNNITLNLASPAHENIYVAMYPTKSAEEFMFRTGDQSNTTLYVVRYANLTRAKGKYYRSNISLLWEFYKENCFAQWDATDFWENYTTGHNENNTLSLWGQATNDLCKDMPTAKEMLAYMTYGDVYSEQTTQWYLDKTIYSGGLWFLPKASIESNQGVSFSTLASPLTPSLSENEENVIQDVVIIDVAHQARPSNPNNYFFIPFLGSYMYHGWYSSLVNPVRRGQEIAIWTSTAAYLAEEVAGLDWNSAFNLAANPGEHEIQYGPYAGEMAVYLSLDHWWGERNMGFLCGVRPNNLPWFK